MICASELYLGNNLGHVTTPISGNSVDGFRYNMHFFIDTPYFLPEYKNSWERINLGNLELGSYAYQITSLNSDNHQIVVYENLYNKKKYIFGNYKNGVPEYDDRELYLPP